MMTEARKNRRLVVACALSTFFGAAACVWAQADAPIRSRDLARAFMEAHGAGDYARAVKIGQQWVAIKPKDVGAAYDLACAYAMSGDKGKAIEWLNKSVELGWDKPGHMLRDSDLKSLRGTPEFDAIVGRARERQKPRLENARTSKPLVIVPPGLDAGQPAPLIVALHGYGGNADSFASVWKEVAADAGAILAVPRAVHSVSMSGFGWGDLDESEAIVRSALDQVVNQHKIDRKRIVLTGFSQGGRMTYGLCARMSDFCGAIPVAGFFDSADSIPSNLRAVGGTRYFIMIGDKDRPGNVESNRLARKELTAAGLDVALVVYPGLGHDFPENRVAELKKALAYVLAP